MPKLGSLGGQTCPLAFQQALDDLGVVGTWTLDAAADKARVDAFVALMFGVEPQAAAAGLPLATFIDAIHADDRQRVVRSIRRAIQEGGPYIAEYRVRSVDGAIRWVLDRGRYFRDHAGRPLHGRGIIVDITRARIGEDRTPDGFPDRSEPVLERAAEHAIAAQQATVELGDPTLKVLADALLLGLGRELARQEVEERRRRMN